MSRKKGSRRALTTNLLQRDSRKTPGRLYLLQPEEIMDEPVKKPEMGDRGCTVRGIPPIDIIELRDGIPQKEAAGEEPTISDGPMDLSAMLTERAGIEPRTLTGYPPVSIPSTVPAPDERKGVSQASAEPAPVPDKGSAHEIDQNDRRDPTASSGVSTPQVVNEDVEPALPNIRGASDTTMRGHGELPGYPIAFRKSTAQPPAEDREEPAAGMAVEDEPTQPDPMTQVPRAPPEPLQAAASLPEQAQSEPLPRAATREEPVAARTDTQELPSAARAEGTRDVVTRIQATFKIDGEPVSVSGKDEITIGRSDDNTLVMTQTSVSKKHARIYYDVERGTFIIHDLDSTNGTQIIHEREDGTEDEPVELKCGDSELINMSRRPILALGLTRLRIVSLTVTMQSEPIKAAEPASKVDDSAVSITPEQPTPWRLVVPLTPKVPALHFRVTTRIGCPCKLGKGIVIGNDESCDLSLDDEKMLPRHVEIRYSRSIIGLLGKPQISARAIGDASTSTNGTNLSTRWTVVKDNDVLVVGDTQISFMRYNDGKGIYVVSDRVRESVVKVSKEPGKNHVTAGSTESCQIRLDDPFVLLEHITFAFDNEHERWLIVREGETKEGMAQVKLGERIEMGLTVLVPTRIITELSDIMAVSMKLYDDEGRLLSGFKTNISTGSPFSFGRSKRGVTKIGLTGATERITGIMFSETDMDVSRKHAELILDDDGRLCARDLNSYNGTYVIRGKNRYRVMGEVKTDKSPLDGDLDVIPIQGPMELLPGDKIKIGENIIQVT